jgi:hypothetical protein
LASPASAGGSQRTRGAALTGSSSRPRSDAALDPAEVSVQVLDVEREGHFAAPGGHGRILGDLFADVRGQRAAADGLARHDAVPLRHGLGGRHHLGDELPLQDFDHDRRADFPLDRERGLAGPRQRDDLRRGEDPQAVLDLQARVAAEADAHPLAVGRDGRDLSGQRRRLKGEQQSECDHLTSR